MLYGQKRHGFIIDRSMISGMPEDYSIPKEIRINRTRGKELPIIRLPRERILYWVRA